MPQFDQIWQNQLLHLVMFKLQVLTTVSKRKVTVFFQNNIDHFTGAVKGVTPAPEGCPIEGFGNLWLLFQYLLPGEECIAVEVDTIGARQNQAVRNTPVIISASLILRRNSAAACSTAYVEATNLNECSSVATAARWNQVIASHGSRAVPVVTARPSFKIARKL